MITEFRSNPICRFETVVILLFRQVGLKMPVYARFGVLLDLIA